MAIIPVSLTITEDVLAFRTSRKGETFEGSGGKHIT